MQIGAEREQANAFIRTQHSRLLLLAARQFGLGGFEVPQGFLPLGLQASGDKPIRALLTARKLVQSRLYDVEMSLRGILRGSGLKVGRTTPKRFAWFSAGPLSMSRLPESFSALWSRWRSRLRWKRSECTWRAKKNNSAS